MNKNKKYSSAATGAGDSIIGMADVLRKAYDVPDHKTVIVRCPVTKRNDVSPAITKEDREKAKLEKKLAKKEAKEKRLKELRERAKNNNRRRKQKRSKNSKRKSD